MKVVGGFLPEKMSEKVSGTIFWDDFFDGV